MYITWRPLVPFCMAKGGVCTLHSCIWQAIHHECLQFQAHPGPHFCTCKDLLIDELKVILQRRKIDYLKSFAKADGLKILSRCRKCEIVGNYKTIGLLDRSTSASVDPSPNLDASEGLNLPPFESVSCWSLRSDPLTDFTFMHLYCYVIESKDKSFNTESLKAFKSLSITCTLKAHTTLYKRLSNHIVCISAFSKPLGKFIQPSILVLPDKCYVKFMCKPMIVIVALLFYLEDFSRRSETNILNGESCMSHLCQ